MNARRLFGSDGRITAAIYLGLATWLLGEVEDSRGAVEQAVKEAHESNDVATVAMAYLFRTLFEVSRGDPAATRPAGAALLAFGREHGMAFHAASGEIYSSWARGRLLDPDAGVSELRRALAAYLAQDNRNFGPCFHGLIAELEALTGRADSALMSVEAGLALAEDTGERWTDPILFRRKGEILLQRDPANPAPAEHAFQTAIEIARRQRSRSFRLRAALSLARLYQSTARPAEALAVLAPALEGFSPTPELPEIAEAQALLAALAESDEVKEAAASRKRRLELQASYGLALTWSRGAPPPRKPRYSACAAPRLACTGGLCRPVTRE